MFGVSGSNKVISGAIAKDPTIIKCVNASNIDISAAKADELKDIISTYLVENRGLTLVYELATPDELDNTPFIFGTDNNNAHQNIQNTNHEFSEEAIIDALVNGSLLTTTRPAHYH